MRRLVVRVPGEPIPEPRKRVRIIPNAELFKKEFAKIAQQDGRWAYFVDVAKVFTRAATKSFVNHYTPSDDPVNAFKDAVALCYRHSANSQQFPKLDQPVAVHMLLVFDQTKTMQKRKTPWPRMWRWTKPDGDNVEKAVLDALSNAGAWSNDSRVVACSWQKVYRRTSEGPATIIVISSVPEDPCDFDVEVWAEEVVRQRHQQ